MQKFILSNPFCAQNCHPTMRLNQPAVYTQTQHKKKTWCFHTSPRPQYSRLVAATCVNFLCLSVCLFTWFFSLFFDYILTFFLQGCISWCKHSQASSTQLLIRSQSMQTLPWYVYLQIFETSPKQCMQVLVSKALKDHDNQMVLCEVICLLLESTSNPKNLSLECKLQC